MEDKAKAESKFQRRLLGGYGLVKGAFKPPRAKCEETRRPQREARKRARISYAEGLGDDDEEVARNTKKVQDDYSPQPLGIIHLNSIFPVFKAAPPEEVFKRKFCMPQLRDKDGKIVVVKPSYMALGTRIQPKIPPRPLFDPMADHAIVLYDPTIIPEEALIEYQKEIEDVTKNNRKSKGRSLAEILGIMKEDPKKESKVPVVIDPRLGKVLRPHQVEGVKFLYNCCTGQTVAGQYGCVMADEMGLGKTLQCLALMWTLLKQSPNFGKTTIQRCIIVCPSSLVRNWANEMVKWLGQGAIHPLVVESNSKTPVSELIQQWTQPQGRSVTQPVLIVSYETLRNLVQGLGDTVIGLLLCDEGHRLKNGDSLTFQELNKINCQRRVILSGTPIQNDLSEYFALLNFANPGYLGTRLDFRKAFELPILKGRDSEATEEDMAVSQSKLAELSARVNPFIIRRTNDLLSKYLPVKYEHVVFCQLSAFQLELYRLFLRSPSTRALLRGKNSQPLKAIGLLKKLCNHPDLLKLPEEIPGSESLIPQDYEARHKNRLVVPHFSGKMRVLERMLDRIRSETQDKIVLISNFTQTLDLFERFCRNKKYGCLRLDGTLSIAKRQKLVDRFNDPEGKEFIFLLSSKAGGCGLNLIGANRLVLFDPDWNPAADQQALARVWRDGQRKDCFVYRFISTGTIEEKIFQRQSHKQSLSSCVVDDGDAERHFSLDNLRQLFEFREDTNCDTHDTYKCKRCKDGHQICKAPAMLYGDTSTWNHFTHTELCNVHDDLLRAELNDTDVSFCFQYCSV